ncbi:MAG: pyridoxal phosphate-dependent aminotransferase [Bacteroidota bacterium]
MPKISKRGNNMPASPIRKLVPYAEQAKKRGVKVYHLNIGQPDIKTPEVAIDAIRNIDLKVLEYSHSAGNESYRKKLAAYYTKQGINITSDELMITVGGSEAIQFALYSCMDAGDEVIIPEPFYANYNGFATAGDIVVKPITTKIENGFALPAVEEFEKLITPKTKAIIICNPNNPTGYLYSKEELMQLREIVLKYDLYLFADEVYREFCYDGKTHTSILNLEGLEQNAVVVDSISKRFSACGARIGCLITRNKDLINAAMKFAQARLSPPSLGQIAGEAALDTDESYFKEVYDEYISRRNNIVSKLNQIPGVVCPTPGGAFYAMIQLPVKDSDHFCQWLLEGFEHDKKTVMLAPGSGFYNTPGLGKNEARVAYVLKNEDIDEAVNCLKLALEAYKKIEK